MSGCGADCMTRCEETRVVDALDIRSAVLCPPSAWRHIEEAWAADAFVRNDTAYRAAAMAEAGSARCNAYTIMMALLRHRQ